MPRIIAPSVPGGSSSGRSARTLRRRMAASRRAARSSSERGTSLPCSSRPRGGNVGIGPPSSTNSCSGPDSFAPGPPSEGRSLLGSPWSVSMISPRGRSRVADEDSPRSRDRSRLPHPDIYGPCNCNSKRSQVSSPRGERPAIAPAFGASGASTGELTGGTPCPTIGRERACREADFL